MSLDGHACDTATLSRPVVSTAGPTAVAAAGGATWPPPPASGASRHSSAVVINSWPPPPHQDHGTAAAAVTARRPVGRQSWLTGPASRLAENAPAPRINHAPEIDPRVVHRPRAWCRTRPLDGRTAPRRLPPVALARPVSLSGPATGRRSRSRSRSRQEPDGAVQPLGPAARQAGSPAPAVPAPAFHRSRQPRWSAARRRY